MSILKGFWNRTKSCSFHKIINMFLKLQQNILILEKISWLFWAQILYKLLTCTLKTDYVSKDSISKIEGQLRKNKMIADIVMTNN
jgi:hypothetical protein